MKRFLSIITIISLLFAFVILPVNANQSITQNDLSITETLKFNSEDSSVSSDKTAENRLEKLGLSPKMKKMMLDRFSDEISSAETISIKTDFYVQKDDGTLSQVTESDYTVAVKEQKQKISENEKKIKENIEKIQENRCVDLMDIDWGDHFFPSTGNQKTIDKGTLKLVIMILSEGRSFFCAGMFQWETMPKSRYTDAFGFTRDVNTTLDAKSQSGYFEYKHTYSYLNGSESVTTEKTIEKEIGFNDLQFSSGGYGYAYKIGLSLDNQQTEYPYMKNTYSDLTGFLCYRGWLNDNVSKANFWATYAHQKWFVTFGGIDFSIPFSAGFSINLSAAYEQLVEEHLWTV